MHIIHRLLLCLLLLLVPRLSTLDSRPCLAALPDCLDATCRVTAPDQGRGTGCVFERSQGQVFVLTCAHVATGQTVQCEFWRDGHQSQPLAGQVQMRSEAADAAVVSIPESAFGGLLPKAIPFAPRESMLRDGDTVTSVGCALGAWSTAWKG